MPNFLFLANCSSLQQMFCIKGMFCVCKSVICPFLRSVFSTLVLKIILEVIFPQQWPEISVPLNVLQITVIIRRTKFSFLCFWKQRDENIFGYKTEIIFLLNTLVLRAGFVRINEQMKTFCWAQNCDSSFTGHSSLLGKNNNWMYIEIHQHSRIRL